MRVNSSSSHYNKYRTYLNWPKYVSDISRIKYIKHLHSIKHNLNIDISDIYLKNIF